MKVCLVVRALALLTVCWLAVGSVHAQVSMTQIEGAVYKANGKPAAGTLLVTWNSFTTATKETIEAGSLSAIIRPDGSVELRLPSNAGATPIGSYYTAMYRFSDGSTSAEEWVVPELPTASIASLRAGTQSPRTHEGDVVSEIERDLVPANSFLPLAGGTLSGPLLLDGDPSSSSEATSMHYVDQAVGTALSLAGGVVTGTVAVANQITKLPRVDIRSKDFAGGADPTGVRDSLAAINAAVAYALASATSNGDATYPTVYLPPGHYRVNGTIRIPSSMHMLGDSKANTILQETGPTANLITVYNATVCSTYSCIGGLENLTLEGTGKATTGTLLEMNVGFFILRDMHFFNSAGRGLQMNGASERIVSYDSSFNDVRWPLVMAGDTNEDYFYNTQIVEAGQTKDNNGSPTWNNNWCYSVNCTNGVFHAPGTSSNPTVLYPEPRGSIHIDKAVNVSFIGGSIKSTNLLSGVRVWNGDMIKFENLYHEDGYGGNIPRTNRAYILGGKGEQTYLTGKLSGSGITVAVHDGSWMPQFFGDPTDVPVAPGDYYPYVLLPQDYNRASTTASAYVPGLKQNQFEVVTIAGFASDGNLYIQSGGRHQGGSTAPAGTQWPSGTVIEQYGAGFEGPVELNTLHLNQVQGPTAVGGYQVGCNQTNIYFCGEVVAGYAPDIQNPTSDPATNQIGFYAPLGDPNDPIPYATIIVNLRTMDMYSSPVNPYAGQIATHHRVNMQIYGPVDMERVESTQAVNANTNGKQISIAAATGGSYVTAPVYPSTGQPAAVQVALPDAETLWDSSRGVFTKRASLFGPYQQYGAYMNGLQFQNQYCFFDTPAVDGGHVTNRFCVGGGPSNSQNNGVGQGGGFEYDSWNGTDWVNLFKVSGQNGAGSISGVAASTTITGTQSSNPPVMVWAPYGVCGTEYLGCQEGGAPLNLINPVTIQAWTMYTTSKLAGCTTLPVISLMNGVTVLGTMPLLNGVQMYTGTLTSTAVPSASSLQIKVTTPGVGCTMNASTFSNNVIYTMQSHS